MVEGMDRKNIISKKAYTMEFNEKLLELRKQKALTQEELAEALYVSRTAISKWESGRGYPNIDSLKAISKFFDVTIDELLSGEQVICIAEDDNKQMEKKYRSTVFGLADTSVALLFFLPFFGLTTDGIVSAVSLLSLGGIAPYLKATYYALSVIITLYGIATLAIESFTHDNRKNITESISLFLNTVALLIFIISSQPYAAIFLLIFLIIKVILLLKKH